MQSTLATNKTNRFHTIANQVVSAAGLAATPAEFFVPSNELGYSLTQSKTDDRKEAQKQPQSLV